MSEGSTASWAIHQIPDGSASTISGVPPREGSKITIPLAVPMQSRIPVHLFTRARIVAQRSAAEQRAPRTRNPIVVKPNPKFQSGVTPERNKTAPFQNFGKGHLLLADA